MRLAITGASLALATAAFTLSAPAAHAGAATESVAAQGPAKAAASAGYTYKCSAGGFTGYVYVNFERGSGRVWRVNWIQYKITGKAGKGRHKADVRWWDGAT